MYYSCGVLLSGGYFDDPSMAQCIFVYTYVACLDLCMHILYNISMYILTYVDIVYSMCVH